MNKIYSIGDLRHGLVTIDNDSTAEALQDLLHISFGCGENDLGSYNYYWANVESGKLKDYICGNTPPENVPIQSVKDFDLVTPTEFDDSDKVFVQSIMSIVIGDYLNIPIRINGGVIEYEEKEVSGELKQKILNLKNSLTELSKHK